MALKAVIQKMKCEDPACAGVVGNDGLCSVCGVDHFGVPCPDCGGCAFHKKDCAAESRRLDVEIDHCTECDGNGYHVEDCPNARRAA
jgi:hypothetical protein